MAARKETINCIVTGQCTIDEGLEKYTETIGNKVQTALVSFNP